MIFVSKLRKKSMARSKITTLLHAYLKVEIVYKCINS